jgi:hypothetical protein
VHSFMRCGVYGKVLSSQGLYHTGFYAVSHNGYSHAGMQSWLHHNLRNKVNQLYYLNLFHYMESSYAEGTLAKQRCSRNR